MRDVLKMLTLLLVMTALAAVLWGCGPGGEAERKETMKSASAVGNEIERPPIDIEQPARFETATFALG